MKKDKKIIIANWKMSPLLSKESQKLFTGIRSVGVKLPHVQTIICPPFLYLEGLQKNAKGHRVVLGAQNVSVGEVGRHTGEISPLMLKNMGINYVILGHSEVRAAGESGETVNAKVKLALQSGLHVILCIGESERDDDGAYLSFIKEELERSLAGVPKNQLDQVIIAYEPIWAVGPTATRVDTPEDVFEMVIYIRKVLTELFGRTIAMKTPILYGGSSNDENAEGLLREGGISGLLVGRASRDIKKFTTMLSIANSL